LAFAACAAACGPYRPRPPAAPEPPRLSPAAAARLIPERVAERDGWARDALAAIEAVGLVPTAEHVCQVFAVVEQESGYRANPTVPNLGAIVERELGRHAARFGPLGRVAVERLLSAEAPGQSKSFRDRLAAVRSEREVDRIFREMVAYYRDRHPAATAAADVAGRLFADRRLEAFNPITTAGSMQVSVRFASELGAREGRSESEIREALYTRAGGLRYGVARLLDYETSYPEALFRFADFNAGLYSSRNAAVQAALSELLGVRLALDGDLLIYEADGDVSSRESRSLGALLAFAERFAEDLPAAQVRRDARREKTFEFEATDTYGELRRVYRARTGRNLAPARLPELVLRGPKLTRELSTAWFARSVDRRYRACLERAFGGTGRERAR
jgi:hypothetical protein